MRSQDKGAGMTTTTCRGPGVFHVLIAVLLVAVGATAGLADTVKADTQRPADTVAGQFLVAEEELEGTSFQRTVIMMIEHGPAGALGVTVNRPLREAALTELMVEVLGADAARDAPIPQEARVRVLSGGPVAQSSMLALHGPGFSAEKTVEVARGIHMTPVRAVMAALAEGEGPELDTLRLYLGHAGWSGGQLEGEKARGSWHVIPADPRLVFAEDPARVWREAMARRQRDL